MYHPCLWLALADPFVDHPGDHRRHGGRVAGAESESMEGRVRLRSAVLGTWRCGAIMDGAEVETEPSEKTLLLRREVRGTRGGADTIITEIVRPNKRHCDGGGVNSIGLGLDDLLHRWGANTLRRVVILSQWGANCICLEIGRWGTIGQCQTGYQWQPSSLQRLQTPR
jgi:hypothetical protein